MAAHGVRLAKIAALCDVDQSTAYRWREGRSQIPDEKKFKLAEFFGVSVPYLMRWETADHDPTPAAA